MARKTDNKPVNENWVRNETLSEYHKSARKTLEKAKLIESENEFIAVRVDKKTVILKRI